MRKHNYLVGYKGEGQCVYGKRDCEFVDLLTLSQARALSKKIFTLKGERKIKSVVYRLAEVKEKGR